MEAHSEGLERRYDAELDNEATIRLLGSLGVVDALSDEYSGTISPDHEDSVWIQRGLE